MSGEDEEFSVLVYGSLTTRLLCDELFIPYPTPCF